MSLAAAGRGVWPLLESSVESPQCRKQWLKSAYITTLLLFTVLFLITSHDSSPTSNIFCLQLKMAFQPVWGVAQFSWCLQVCKRYSYYYIIVRFFFPVNLPFITRKSQSRIQKCKREIILLPLQSNRLYTTEPQCVVGCDIWVCVRVLCDVHTIMKSPEDFCC